MQFAVNTTVNAVESVVLLLLVLPAVLWTAFWCAEAFVETLRDILKYYRRQRRQRHWR